MFKIVEKEKLASIIHLLKIEAPDIARKVKPGQFVVIRINEEGERFPLTINDFDGERGTINLIFQEMGKSTKLLAKLKVDDSIADVVGPLGNPSEIERYGLVVCVGGGVGTACIYPVTRALYQAGNEVISIVGARTAELLLLEEEMKAVSHRLLITTDDGTKGHHGLVTDVLKQILEEEQRIDRVIAIGPAVMMRFVCKTTEPFGVKTVVSLNPIMVDATGMCGACRVSVGGETKFTCVDGPEFDGHLVDFDLLMDRLNQYVEEEKIALETLKG